MTRLLVNGEIVDLETPATVADVVAAYCPSAEGVAVARNREVVPRSAWTKTLLACEDQVEIVTAVAGG